MDRTEWASVVREIKAKLEGFSDKEEEARAVDSILYATQQYEHSSRTYTYAYYRQTQQIY